MTLKNNFFLIIIIYKKFFHFFVRRTAKAQGYFGVGSLSLFETRLQGFSFIGPFFDITGFIFYVFLYSIGSFCFLYGCIFEFFLLDHYFGMPLNSNYHSEFMKLNLLVNLLFIDSWLVVNLLIRQMLVQIQPITNVQKWRKQKAT